jgi:hypothetical protein
LAGRRVQGKALRQIVDSSDSWGERAEEEAVIGAQMIIHLKERFRHLTLAGRLVAIHSTVILLAIRYRIDSRLLIAVGALNEDEKREGAFYYVLQGGKLKRIFAVNVQKDNCHAH